MDPYIAEWLNLILRWLHLITGIAWIGASFYFVWLDNSLQRPPEWKKEKGIRGDLWAIHGGGFYEVAKYQMAPEQMPQTLHWFKWEAYSTWITGFLLLSVMFYVGADAYLIDPRVAELTQWQAIGIGVGSLVVGWFAYDILCNSPLQKNGYLLAGVLMVLATGLIYFLTHTFSARGAYIHVGAIIGTAMVGNVFRVIIPSQRALVNAVQQGTEPDPSWGAKAKLRSTHNNYLTLPLLFIMISNHYPITYNHPYNWVVLAAIILITAFARHYFNLEHRGIKKPAIIVVAAIATVILAWAIAPQKADVSETAATEINVHQVETIIQNRCGTCHSANPTDDVFTVAPGGVMLDSMAQIKQWAPRIKSRTVDTEDMPFMNKTEMKMEERHLLAAWIAAGSPLE